MCAYVSNPNTCKLLHLRHLCCYATSPSARCTVSSNHCIEWNVATLRNVLMSRWNTLGGSSMTSGAEVSDVLHKSS